MNTSELNAFEELEGLAIMKEKTSFQSQMYYPHHSDSLPKLDSDTKQTFDKIIDSKIDFIKKDASSRVNNTRSVEPMAALERLAEVQKKHRSRGMDDLLVFKIKEVVYTPEPKVSPRSNPVIRGRYTHMSQPLTQSTTVSSANVVAVPVCVSPNFPRLAGILVDKVPQASQKQKISGHDLPSECNESKTTPKFVTSHLSWVQDQNNVHTEWLQEQNKINTKWLQEQNKINTKWLQVRIKLHTEDDDDSTEDWGELTPTSTIMSGQLESTD